jgi:RNA polymerase sigma-70 factor (ECF subfamily)
MMADAGSGPPSLLGALWERYLELEYEQTPELDLARLALQGDESAFEEIVRRFSPRVFRIASHFFRRRELAEEAAQEVFLQAYSQLRSFEFRGSLEGWLARIATNVCINLLRHTKRRPESSISELTDDENRWFERNADQNASQSNSSVEDRVVAADLAQRVLETLSADDRIALMLIDGDQLSVKEAAEATGWSQSKVKVQAMRARRRFREAVERLLGARTNKPR